MARILYGTRKIRKKRKISMRSLFPFAVIFLALIFFGTAGYAVRLPQWQIQTIEITGLQTLDSGTMQASIMRLLDRRFFLIFPGTSFFLASAETIETTLKKEFPRINIATASKNFPDTLHIKIHERELYAVYCSITNCAYIDGMGFAYDDALRSEGNLILKIKKDVPSIFVGETVLDENTLKFINFLSERLEPSAKTDFIEFEIATDIPSEIRIETADGFSLIIKRDDDFNNIARVLSTVLEKEIGKKRNELEYIDLRFGNKAFYKMKVPK